jgi:hypothetical protein
MAQSEINIAIDDKSPEIYFDESAMVESPT